MIRINDYQFVIDGVHYRFFFEDEAEEPFYGVRINDSWAKLNLKLSPYDVDLKQICDVFWREVRQNRPVDLTAIVREAEAEAESRELMEV